MKNEESEKIEPFLHHIIELRNRVLFTVTCFILVFIISYFSAPYLFVL